MSARSFLDPDFDLILTRFGPEKADFGFESGQNRVRIRSRGRGSEGVGPSALNSVARAIRNAIRANRFARIIRN